MPTAATTRTGVQQIALQTRLASVQPNTYRAEDNTIEVVFSAGARVQRLDYWSDTRYDEELVVSPDAVDLSRIEAGAVQVLDNHNQYSGLAGVLGVVTRAWIEGNEARAELRLSTDPAKAGVVADIKAGVIRSISVGYSVQRYEITPAAERTDGGVDLWRATRWQPQEISFVTVPADPGAGTRSAPSQATHACEFVTRGQPAASLQPEKEGTMPQTTQATAEPSQSAADAQTAAAVATTATPPAAPDAGELAQRAADISELCTRHAVPHMAAELIRSGATMDRARADVLQALAVRSAGGQHRPAQVQTVTDETEVRLRGMEDALLHRLLPSHPLDDNARQYRSLTLIELGREHLERTGTNTRGMDRMQLAQRMLQVRAAGMHTTSDFGYLFGNVASRRLRAAYDAFPTTYAEWARRGPNLADFKPITIVGLGAGPELLKVNEHGEFKYGTFGDSSETYQLATYGRIVAMTRQAIINDDLRGFDRLLSLFASSASRLENRLVYEQLTANAKMGDGKALFHADHGNLLSGAGSALSLEGLQAARAKMRGQKGTEGDRINVSPKYLIVPSALETLAYQLTSNAYTPAKMADVNDFRVGGRTPLEVIVEPLLDDASTTAWYLAADSAVIDTVEFAYLEGADGPVTETREGFEVDGTEVKCRLDFAAKALDWRGLVKSAGA